MQLSRRDFLKGAAAGAAGVAVLGIAGLGSAAEGDAGQASASAIPTTEGFSPCFAPEAVDIAFVAEPITAFAAEFDVDVAICGCGLSGASAAASCAQQGLNVVILEKQDHLPFRGVDIAALGDRTHAAQGIALDKREFVTDGMLAASFRCQQDMWKVIADYSGEAMDWMCDLLGDKIGNTSLAFKNGNVMTAHGRWWGTAVNFEKGIPAVIQGLADYAVEHGAELYMLTPAVQLLMDGKAVVGVVARTDAGYVKYNAKKGVILATGGYEHNNERLQKYMRPRDLNMGAWLMSFSTTGATGDGHEMGLMAGGMEDEYPHCIMTDPECLMSWIRVNRMGQRFCAEFVPYNHIANAIQNQPGGYCYMICDANGQQAAEAMWGDSHIYGSPESWFGMMAASEIKADTLGELAELMGVDKENFLATCARLNECVEQGIEDDYQNPANFIYKMDTPPFYARREMVDGLTTVSGLRVTPHSEVYDKDFNPIPGLYALGNTSGNMFAGTYPHNMNGVSHARCLTFGYRVGAYIAGN